MNMFLVHVHASQKDVVRQGLDSLETFIYLFIFKGKKEKQIIIK